MQKTSEAFGPGGVPPLPALALRGRAPVLRTGLEDRIALDSPSRRGGRPPLPPERRRSVRAWVRGPGLEDVSRRALGPRIGRELEARVPSLVACLPDAGAAEAARAAGTALNAATRHSHHQGRAAPGLEACLVQATRAWAEVAATLSERAEPPVQRPTGTERRQVSLTPGEASTLAAVTEALAAEQQIVLWWTARGLAWPAPVASARLALEVGRQAANLHQLARYGVDVAPLLEGVLRPLHAHLLRPVGP